MLSRSILVSIVSTLIFFFSATAQSQDSLSESGLKHLKADLGQLLDGVGLVTKPGIPGPVAITGPSAFAVVMANCDGVDLPIVGAARHGQGRVLIFGHGSYFSQESIDHHSTGKLIQNGAKWLCKGKAQARVLCVDASPIAKALKAMGYEVEDLKGEQAIAQAVNFDLICFNPHRAMSNDLADKLRAWIANGGAVMAAGLGWGWKQLRPGKSLLYDHGGSTLLGPIGLRWADGYIKNPIASADSLSALHAGRGNARVELRLLQDKAGQSAASYVQSMRLLESTCRSLPVEADPFIRDVIAFIKNTQKDVATSGEKPEESARALERLDTLIQHLLELRKDPSSPRSPHKLASEFPGLIPPDAVRLKRSMNLNMKAGGWISTGLYAPPGEVISLRTRLHDKGMHLRIGCHKDELWGKARWRRHPEITRTQLIDSANTQLVNIHGGPIYIEAGPYRGLAEIEIEGGVEMPRFVLGQSSLADWRERARHLPVPWAELESGKIVLTVESKHIRNLDDPHMLLKAWNRVLDCYVELGKRPLPTRPDRFVTDLQISAGYMHSGYPIMTHLDAGQRIVDVLAILGRPKPSIWGLWHELGHNHQKSDWTFRGTTEVTCNLFTLFVLDKVSGLLPKDSPRFIGMDKKVAEYRRAGAKFETWQAKPFLALYMYVQLQKEFGWELFQKAFAEYRDLPKSERPVSELAKRDQWMVRLSKISGRNLGPFFDSWGVPVSSEAKQSIEGLPLWQPSP